MAQALTRVFGRTFRRFTFPTIAALSTLWALSAFMMVDEGAARAQIAQPNLEPPIGSIYGGLPLPGLEGSTNPAPATTAPTPETTTSPPVIAPAISPPSNPLNGAAAPAPPLPPATPLPAAGAPVELAPPPEHVAAAEHPHPTPSGQGRRGFVVAAQFGVRPTFSQQMTAGAVSTSMTSALQGGLALGFKTGRVMMTLGLDLGAIDVRDSFTYRTTTTFLVVPGLQVALLRSKDHRVELVGSLRVGAGSTMTTDASATGKTPALVMYEIAPAVRYWAHKQFAVQFLAGYGGEYTIVSGGGGNTATGQHGLSAAIGTIGIF